MTKVIRKTTKRHGGREFVICLPYLEWILQGKVTTGDTNVYGECQGKLDFFVLTIGCLFVRVSLVRPISLYGRIYNIWSLWFCGSRDGVKSESRYRFLNTQV